MILMKSVCVYRVWRDDEEKATLKVKKKKKKKEVAALAWCEGVRLERGRPGIEHSSPVGLFPSRVMLVT